MSKSQTAAAGTARMLATWGAAVLIVAVAVAPLVLHWLTNPADQRLVDLDVYRTGGQSVLLGRPVYEVVTPPPQLLPFTYPPIAALLAVPLAWLPWPVAQWVWILVIYAAVAITVWYGFRALLTRLGHWAPMAAAVLVALCAYPLPMADQVRFGQVDIVLVALCLADCATRSPRWPRGLLIGIATAVKLTPGVFLIYLALVGRWRAFWVGTATTAVLTLLPFVIIPSDATDFWFSALLDSERLGSNKATTNQSIRGMLLRLYLPDSLTSALWLALVALVAWYGLRSARRWGLAASREPSAEVTAVALVGLMAVLLSPVAWIHHLAWIVVVLGALVGSGRDRLCWVIAGVVWLYYVLTLPWWGVSMLASGLLVPGKIVQDAYGLGAIALVWLLGGWLYNRRARSFLPP